MIINYLKLGALSVLNIIPFPLCAPMNVYIHLYTHTRHCVSDAKTYF